MFHTDSGEISKKWSSVLKSETNDWLTNESDSMIDDI